MALLLVILPYEQRIDIGLDVAECVPEMHINRTMSDAVADMPTQHYLSDMWNSVRMLEVFRNLSSIDTGIM